MLEQAKEVLRAGADGLLHGIINLPVDAEFITLILHAEAGLKPSAIIQAATINAARMIGREKDLGTIEAGKFADLLILDANPLDDIRNIKQIRLVIKGGTIFDPAELLRQ